MSSPALSVPSFFWRNPIILWVCCEFFFQFLLLSWYFPRSDMRLHIFLKVYNIWENLCPDRGNILTLRKNDERFSLIVTLYCMYHREELECFHPQSFESPYFTTHTLKHVLCISHVETLCRRIWLQKWAKPWILSIHFSCTRSMLDKQTWLGRGDEIIILFV